MVIKALFMIFMSGFKPFEPSLNDGMDVNAPVDGTNILRSPCYISACFFYIAGMAVVLSNGHGGADLSFPLPWGWGWWLFVVRGTAGRPIGMIGITITGSSI